MKKVVTTDKAPAPVGPYSQGVVSSGRTLYVAGQIPRNPSTGQVPQDFRSQVVQCLDNIKAIVEAAGATMADVVKVNAYLTDLSNFPVFNEIYATYFTAPHPARTTVGAVLPAGTLQLEIDAIVALPK